MPDPGIRAVDRTTLIIRLLAEERRPLTIGDISAATRLAPSTVHRILSTLMKDDWVEQNPATTRYHLGFGLLGIAATSLLETPLVEKARATLVRISAVSDLHSWLGVLVGRRIAYLSEVEGRQSKYRPFEVGRTHHAHATCGGKLLLAALDPSEVKRLYRNVRELQRYTDVTITDPTSLEGELEEIRTKGFALDRGELRESWYGVAVPVRVEDGRVIAALVTGGLEVPLEQLEALVPEIKFLSTELTMQLSAYDS
jgi:DNA-binding IclR family transcriptional regulator